MMTVRHPRSSCAISIVLIVAEEVFHFISRLDFHRRITLHVVNILDWISTPMRTSFLSTQVSCAESEEHLVQEVQWPCV